LHFKLKNGLIVYFLIKLGNKMQPWEKNFENKTYGFDDHTKVYLNTYKNEHIRNKRIGWIFSPLIFLATFIPPLSLLFSIPGIVATRKGHGLKYNIIGSVFAAVLPLFSGLWCVVIKGFFKQSEHKIQRQPYLGNTFDIQALTNKETKRRMAEFDPELNLKKTREGLDQKNKKVKISKNTPVGMTTFVYMDSAQKARWAKLAECKTILDHVDSGKISREVAHKKLSRIYQFFQEKHKESCNLAKKFEEKYNNQP
jgi:hypothetical protein